MNKLSEVSLIPFQKSSNYIKPLTMYFTLNGKQRTWDMLEAHDGVAIILYNITRNVLVFVKQFRPAVFYGHIATDDRKGIIDLAKYPVDLGITIELCAGIVDKNVSLAQIAQEEIFEECGYKVPVESLQNITSYCSNVGTSASLYTTYYCEITDDMKCTPGGGSENECIEIVEMTIPDVKKYISQPNLKSPPSFLLGIYWFLCHKCNGNSV